MPRAAQNLLHHSFTWYRASPPLPSNNRQFFSVLLHTMSSSAPPQTTTIPSTLSIPINEKLTKTNYPLWRAQVLPLFAPPSLRASSPALRRRLISMSLSPTLTRPSPRRLIPRIMHGSPETKLFSGMFYLLLHKRH
jgi:hypothetical protein